MILQPVIHPLLLAALVGAASLVAVRSLMRARGPRERTAWVLRLAAVAACALLALRPGIPGGDAETLATETDVVILVDSTASIAAEDWGDGAPRLDGVRADVAALVAAYPGARFALITFDAAAELRLPLTTDTAALRSALEVLTPEVTQRSRGSSIGIASGLLAQTLEDAAAAAPDRSRMVFYLGDGEQTAEAAPESFRDSAGLVDGGGVLGYGTGQGGRMRVQTGDVGGGGDEYILDGTQPALSRIDEEALRTIADDLGVAYQHRAAGTPPELPEAPATTTARAAGTTGDATELSWVVALALSALLAADAALAASAIPVALRVRGVWGSTPGGRA